MCDREKQIEAQKVKTGNLQVKYSETPTSLNYY